MSLLLLFRPDNGKNAESSHVARVLGNLGAHRRAAVNSPPLLLLTLFFRSDNRNAPMKDDLNTGIQQDYLIMARMRSPPTLPEAWATLVPTDVEQ